MPKQAIPGGSANRDANTAGAGEDVLAVSESTCRELRFEPLSASIASVVQEIGSDTPAGPVASKQAIPGGCAAPSANTTRARPNDCSVPECTCMGLQFEQLTTSGTPVLGEVCPAEPPGPVAG